MPTEQKKPLGFREEKKKQKKKKEKQPLCPPGNHCCNPRKISSALHRNAAITRLTTAVSLERWKSAHSLAFLLSPGQQPLHEVLFQHVVHRAAVVARQRGLRVASVHRSGARSPDAEAVGRVEWRRGED